MYVKVPIIMYNKLFYWVPGEIDLKVKINFKMDEKGLLKCGKYDVYQSCKLA